MLQSAGYVWLWRYTLMAMKNDVCVFPCLGFACLLWLGQCVCVAWPASVRDSVWAPVVMALWLSEGGVSLA